MSIEASAPTRIDLAGGTVDIWPLYLFLKDPTTINLAIDLKAEAKLETTPNPGVILRSQDQNAEFKLAWSELEKAKVPPSLEIHLRLLRFFVNEKRVLGRHSEQEGIRLSTVARSPAGAGLGGSSCLSIAIIGALGTWARGSIDIGAEGERLIEIARDTETTVINVPAGLQDYYGSMFGGLQAIRWRPAAHQRDWLDETVLGDLESRLMLFYSGQSRNSGINNWALFKAFIDNVGQVRTQFEQISESTAEVESALSERDWKGLGTAIAREWSVRKTLAQGISTREMDAAFEAAYAEGATAGKVCGAGGGGCFFLYAPTPDPELRARIEKRVTDLGIRSLPFKASPRGLSVQVGRA